MVARILAIVAAVAMVIGALAARAAMDDDGSGLGGGNAQPLSLVCTPDLAAVCDVLSRRDERLVITVEDATTTFDRLVGTAPDDAALDGWLTPGPWPEMVDEARRAAAREPLFEPLGEPVARSFLVVVARTDRAQALRSGACSGEVPVTWECVGQAALDGFRLAAPPASDGQGLLVHAAVAGSVLEDPDFARNDLEEQLDAVVFLNEVQERIRQARSRQAGSIERFVAAPAVADGFATTEAAAARHLFGSRNREALQLVYPVVTGGQSPLPAVADLVVGLAADTDAGGAVDELLRGDEATEVIRQAGWRLAGTTGIVGVDPSLPLPDDADGIPSAGVLVALREVLG